MICPGRNDVAVQPMLDNLCLQVDGAHIWLNDCDLILDVYLDGAVHPLQV